MALHDYDPVEGLKLWKEWSARGKKYVEAEPGRKWESFGKLQKGAPRITIRTLFALARKNGWVPCQVPLGGEDPLALKYGEPVICRTPNSCDVNQQYVAAYYVNRAGVIYDAATKGFWEYDIETGLWKPLSEALHLQQLADVYREVLIENGAGHLLASRRTRTLQQISVLARGIAYRENAFGEPHSFMHLANGMLHITPEGKVELHPFSPDYYSRNRSEIAWDSEAQCSEFLSAIQGVLPPDDCRVLQQYVGQCLLGSNYIQQILVLRGPAATMKSTLQRILMLLVGEANVETLRPQHLGGRFELYRFAGSTLLVAADVSAEFLSSESAHALKSLVGGDTMSVERKGIHEKVTIRGTYNVCVTSNVDLRIRLDGDREPWERRLLILDFQGQKPTRRIPDYAGYIIEQEGPGILRWAVEGAVALLQQVQTSGTLQLSPTQQGRVDDLLSQSDSVTCFVSNCVHKDQGSDMSVAEMYEAYDEFCGLRGWGSLSERQFERSIPHIMKSRLNVVKSHSIQRNFRQVRGFRGVRLVQQQENTSTDSSTVTDIKANQEQEN